MYAHSPLNLYIICLPNISKMSQKVCFFSSIHGFLFKEITETEIKGQRLFLHSTHCQKDVQVALILMTTNAVKVILYEPRSDKRDLLAIKVKSEIFTEKERSSCCEQ